MDLSSEGYGVALEGIARDGVTLKLDSNLLAPIYQFLQE
ncbi:hypothetical protein SAMN05421784_10196 [Xenorhabdus koppenhoeferi]|uniref:Uncharacterized protein n=1 Tax=Xenorhabdus koppenhoeferi TaxID=351659 RepID=A0A1I7ESX1_9GAMM|nr:hypothetical protein SAMN05421784_10196 [Xenorhabdus koppenhoeferi]